MRMLFIHLDCVSMFVSVERILHPEWDDKILIVGEDSLRSVVSSADYTARAYGVRAGMPIYKAKNILEGKAVIFCPVNYPVYLEFSEKIKNKLLRFGKLEATCGIDEFFLDANDYLKKNNLTALQLSNLIKKTIKEEIGMDLSIGISDRKWLSKYASSKNKNSVSEIYSDNIKEIWNDKMQKMQFIGPKTAQKLKLIGVQTFNDFIKHKNPEILKRTLGKTYELVYARINGWEDDEIIDDTKRKQVSLSTVQTFIEDKDYRNKKEIHEVMLEMAKKVFTSLNEINAKFRTITLTIRNDKFKTITRSLSLKYHTNDWHWFFSSLLSLYMLKNNFSKIRLLGVGVHNLSYNN